MQCDSRQRFSHVPQADALGGVGSGQGSRLRRIEHHRMKSRFVLSQAESLRAAGVPDIEDENPAIVTGAREDVVVVRMYRQAVYSFLVQEEVQRISSLNDEQKKFIKNAIH